MIKPEIHPAMAGAAFTAVLAAIAALWFGEVSGLIIGWKDLIFGLVYDVRRIVLGL